MPSLTTAFQLLALSRITAVFCKYAPPLLKLMRCFRLSMVEAVNERHPLISKLKMELVAGARGLH